MRIDTIKSPAKINLYLHITGKDKFGYHLLDTLVSFLPDLYDVITLKEHHENVHKIETQGKWKDLVTTPNILEKALHTLDPFLKNKKFYISLKKNIPVGAGLGGGSCNAAYLINHLITKCKLNITETEKQNIFSSIGADVAMFNRSKALYAMGIGDVLLPVTKFPQNLFALIVYPNKLFATELIYKNFVLASKEAIVHKYNLDQKTLLSLLNNTNNCLYKSSLDFMPELAKIISTISDLKGCLTARMSGSGSACFGIFDNLNELKFAESLLKETYNAFYITTSRMM